MLAALQAATARRPVTARLSGRDGKATIEKLPFEEVAGPRGDETKKAKNGLPETISANTKSQMPASD